MHIGPPRNPEITHNLFTVDEDANLCSGIPHRQWHMHTQTHRLIWPVISVLKRKHYSLCKSDYRHPFSNVLNYCCLADDASGVDAIKKMSISTQAQEAPAHTHNKSGQPFAIVSQACINFSHILFPVKILHRTLFINSYFITRLPQVGVDVVAAINVQIMFSESQHEYMHTCRGNERATHSGYTISHT